MDSKTVAMAGSAFLVFAFLGFYTAYMTGQDSGDLFTKSMNVTVDSDRQVATASFDNRSIDLIHENRDEARMYIDLDQDGSFDVELQDLERDGEIHDKTVVVTQEGRTYRLYFNYRDSSGTGDSWLTLYLVREVK